jgi:diphthamide biosynthesis protein 4
MSSFKHEIEDNEDDICINLTFPYNLYDELEIHSDSTIDTIKSSYQRLLLLHHPDKRNLNINKNINIDNDEKFRRIHSSWKILSNNELRLKYDKQMLIESQISSVLDKAEGVSLNEFVSSEYVDDNKIYSTLYTKTCRCGDVYEILQEDIDNGVNTIQCNGCSLYVTLS